jgi:hypothetical protein
MPATTKGCLTPFICLTASRFALITLPPRTGVFSNTAYSIPGTVTSMPNIGFPVMMSFVSAPAVVVPMIL